jgi:hypothetical protein
LPSNRPAATAPRRSVYGATPAEQQPTYAPELNIVGAVAGGAGVNPTALIPMMDGSIFSGIPFGGLIGFSRESPEFDLFGALTPHGQAMVASAAEMTVEQLFMSFPFLHWSEFLTVPLLEIPGIRAVFDANSLGQATPATTLYLYHAVHDQNLPIADVDKLVEKYRREGVELTYRRFRFSEHVIAMLSGVPSSLRFLNERFSSPARQPCGANGRRAERTGRPGR